MKIIGLFLVIANSFVFELEKRFNLVGFISDMWKICNIALQSHRKSVASTVMFHF